MPPKTPAPLFPQPDNFEVKVWRYLDLAKAISFLQSEQIYFRRSDLFQDAFEGTITKPLAEAWARIAARVKAPKIEEVMSIGRKCARKTVYINCWHLDDSESEAMWQLYCPNNHGIVIQTTYTKLAKWSLQLPDSFIGKVTYLDYKSERFDGHYLNAFMHKRRSFAYESEARIIYSEHKKLGQHDAKNFDELVEIEKKLSSQPTGKNFKFPFKNVEKILVNPYAPVWYFDMFSKLVSSLQPMLKNRVQRSKLKDAPFF